MAQRQPHTPEPDRATGDAPANAPDTATTSPPQTSGSEQPTREYRGTGIMWTGALVVTLVALALIAGLQNTQNVEIHFLWLDGTMPLALLLLIAIAATVVVTEAVGFVWRHRRRRRLRERDELKRLRSN